MKDKQFSPNTTSSWRGYTLEELRYQRMLALTRVEIEKAKLLDATETTRESLPIIGSSSAGTLFKSISKLEYLFIAIRLFRKIAPLFRKKR